MSETVDTETQADADPKPGSLLKRERERRALSVQQTAEDLHLDPWVIEAIESNRFQELGAPVYARGHLRKYAARLGLSIEDIIERYEALQDRPVETDPIPTAVATPVRPLRRSLKVPVRITFAILLVAGASWAAMALLSSDRILRVFQSGSESDASLSVPPPLADAVTDSPASPLVAQAALPQATSSPPPLEGSAGGIEAPAAASNASEADTEPDRAAAAGESVDLRLEFSGESWTEVVDAQGKRLMFAMGSPGRIRTMSGVAPLQVTLGVASLVSAQVNGRPIVIPQIEGRDSTRFVIEADGNLR